MDKHQPLPLTVVQHTWNEAPEYIRSYVKAFLLEDIACQVSRDPVLDGYRIELTGGSPLSQSSLRVLLSAIRDFYAVMTEAGLYAVSAA